MSRLSTVVLAAPLAVLFCAVAAQAKAPDSLRFTVLRNGEAVGHHTLAFRNDPKGLDVTIDTDVVVKIAIIPVYRFEHHDEEVWQNNRLVALSSTTNDDGTHHRLKVSADEGGLAVRGDDKPSRLPPAILPASLWNPATVGQATLLNTLDGRTMAVHVADLGDETVSVHGQPRPARHYAVTGDLAREVWYDADGTLVQVRFKAKDDSDIRYVLQ